MSVRDARESSTNAGFRSPLTELHVVKRSQAPWIDLGGDTETGSGHGVRWSDEDDWAP